MAVGIHYADHTWHHPQKLALTSPTSGGRSVGIVRLWPQATEFSLVLFNDVVSSETIFILIVFTYTMHMISTSICSISDYIRL
jgi:hypothetical protein